MAHLIESVAYVNDTPWHGLGKHLTENQPLSVWTKEAGMAWQIEETPVLYNTPFAGIHPNPNAKVLFRSDTLAPLSVVSNRYKVVQPEAVLKFYRDLVSVGGFTLETAGVLKGGKKLWALAKTGLQSDVKAGDTMKAYLLLATSCDGTLCTTAQFTSVRVVCNNTLQLALGDNAGVVKAPHSTSFDANAVKASLGLGLSSWESFMDTTRQLAQRKVHKFEALRYVVQILGDTSLTLAEQFPSSISPPAERSRHLYAGCRQTHIQVAAWLIPRRCRVLGFGIVAIFDTSSMVHLRSPPFHLPDGMYPAFSSDAHHNRS